MENIKLYTPKTVKELQEGLDKIEYNCQCEYCQVYKKKLFEKSKLNKKSGNVV